MKLLIVDTQGEQISEAFKKLLPGLELIGHEMAETRGTPCHEHGSFCGWLSGVPLVVVGGHHEVHFARIFDQQAREVVNSDQWLLDLIAQLRPDVISRSWGLWDQDSELGAMAGRIMYGDWVSEYVKLQADIGFVDFGAAGNEDELDADNDVAFPQQLMPDVSNIIGACRRDGVPTEWSSDGDGVQCVMWGDKIWSPDQNGLFRLWSGTSAATPKAAGACAASGLFNLSWREAVIQTADKPYGAELPHPKYGFGCMEEAWQKFARIAPAAIMPPHSVLGVSSASVTPEFMEFRRLR